MEEFSLYVLDIVMNSVRAHSREIAISLREAGPWLTFTVEDDGCGMTPDVLARLDNPFFTTRQTRAVGLGVPFLKMLAQQTGGHVTISSVPEAESPERHGTKLVAVFGRDHIDFIPLGDMPETIVTLIQGAPDINFTFTHETENGTVHLSCAEIREVLGGEISLASFEVLSWIREYLRGGYLAVYK